MFPKWEVGEEMNQKAWCASVIWSILKFRIPWVPGKTENRLQIELQGKPSIQKIKNSYLSLKRSLIFRFFLVWVLEFFYICLRKVGI